MLMIIFYHFIMGGKYIRKPGGYRPVKYIQIISNKAYIPSAVSVPAVPPTTARPAAFIAYPPVGMAVEVV